MRSYQGYWSFCSPKAIDRIAAVVADRMDERDMSELFGEPLEEGVAYVWASSIPMSRSVHSWTIALWAGNSSGHTER